MLLLVWYLTVVFIGYIIGMLIRRKGGKRIKWISPVQGVIIILLLLIMGIRLGANDDVINGLGTIGITGLITAVFALVGSLIFVYFTRKILGINKKGEKAND